MCIVWFVLNMVKAEKVSSRILTRETLMLRCFNPCCGGSETSMYSFLHLPSLYECPLDTVSLGTCLGRGERCVRLRYRVF